MESFIFAMNAVLPIILTVAVGYYLRKKEFIDLKFAKMANRIVFQFFIPALLFINVYEIEDIGDIDFSFIIYGLIVLVSIFLLAIPCAMAFTKESPKRGVLIQASFRSNFALVGIPLAMSLAGEEGAAAASLLSAALIPVFNIFAVISLSVFGNGNSKPSIKKIIIGIAKNPLILSILAGLLALLVRSYFVEHSISFRLSDITPIFEVLKSLSKLATPLALLSLGAQFEFSAIKELKREIIFGTCMRIVLAPILGIAIAYFAFRSSFNGAHFAAFIAAFATPVAVSSVPMSQEMGGDVRLAGQLVIWTTLLSVVSQFIAAFLLKSAGVF